MKCFYLNLDAALQRKASIEVNFKKNKKENWSLTRVSAIDVNFINSHKINGSLKPTEKACFLSHKKIIQENLEEQELLFILEDDAIFGKDTCEIIEKIIGMDQNIDWDILFTDVCVPHLGTMADLLKLRQQLVATNQVRLLDLKLLPFAGSTAYILNSKSKNKIYNLLNLDGDLAIPYDLYLRKLIYESKIKGFVVFPFITSLSESSEESSVQSIGTKMTDLVWNLYRKMIWRERNLDQYKPVLEKIEQGLSDEARAFGTLWAAMADKTFKVK
jgi:GR25 family glycosyltransferase involved in LPS biosynthesis